MFRARVTVFHCWPSGNSPDESCSKAPSSSLVLPETSKEGHAALAQFQFRKDFIAAGTVDCRQLSNLGGPGSSTFLVTKFRQLPTIPTQGHNTPSRNCMQHKEHIRPNAFSMEPQYIYTCRKQQPELVLSEKQKMMCLHHHGAPASSLP